jgi:ribosomal protein L11 methyltransferase
MVDSNWLEVSMIVDGELAEAVAEVMARFIPNGVVIESTAVSTADPNSAGHPVGPLRVSGYIPVDEQLEATRHRLEEAFWYLSRIRPLPAANYQPLQQVNWAETWKQHFHPIPVGERLMIVPAWLEPDTGNRIPLRIDPGMAFGTGTHPTTQLCLEFVEEIQFSLDDHKPIDVIDVGCGSGILSIAALKLGARHALAVDIDPEAVAVAKENARLNAVDNRIELRQGTLTEILSGNYSIQKAPLVMANILAPVILRMLAEGLGDLLTVDGHLILSGILEEQASEIENTLMEQGLQLIERSLIDDWVALYARPNA